MQLSEQAKVCIDGIDKKTLGTGERQRIFTNYKLANRSDALKFLMELMAKYDAKGEGSIDSFTADKRKEVQEIFNNAKKKFSKSTFTKYNLENDPHMEKIISIDKNNAG